MKPEQFEVPALTIPALGDGFGLENFEAATIHLEQLDRFTHAAIARMTMGVSPAALGMAYLDWLSHLAAAPGKQLELGKKAGHKWARLIRYAARAAANPDCGACIDPLSHDRQFIGDDWKVWPYNVMSQGFLLAQQWWHTATTGVRGVSPHHEAVVSFVGRQILDMLSPSNNPFLNPEVLRRTIETGGANLRQGYANWSEDAERVMRDLPHAGADAFRPGEQVAITAGKVVFRNRVMELIQYEPMTKSVCAEPVLIVLAWIMKYYILDLSPENSLVRYLVEHGHTVFMVSWKNPRQDERDLSLQDYLHEGALAAVDAVSAIVPGRKIHATGYCLGGTLLAIAASTLARRKDERLKTVTLLAAQTDFTEAGELMLFIDDAELSFLDDLMWSQGFLETKQMAGTFQLLRSNDLIWSHMVHEYLMGERAPMTDLMAWNADGTRMPARMQGEYLRSMFLNNDLAEGRYKVDGSPVTIEDIHVPVFAVGTETDHVAPWRSVFKIHLLAETEVTFVLTSGGHNAGIVSEPGHHGQFFRIARQKAGDPYRDPDAWRAEVPAMEGSWWPKWEEWLTANSSERAAPPPMGAVGKQYPVLGSAPGNYVLER